MTLSKIQTFGHPLWAKYNFFRQKFGQKSDLFFWAKYKHLEKIRNDFGQNTNFIKQWTKLTLGCELSADKKLRFIPTVTGMYFG